MITSIETKNVLKALALLKTELLPVTKGEDNPFFRSKYADLNTHLDAVEPLAMKYGMLLTQATGSTTTGLNFVETRLTHVESGEFVASALTLVLAKQDMQNMGSAVTYARRYTLGALLGMKAVDDDANLASGKTNTTAATSSYSSAAKPKSSFRKKAPPPESVAEIVAKDTLAENGGDWEN